MLIISILKINKFFILRNQIVNFSTKDSVLLFHSD